MPKLKFKPNIESHKINAFTLIELLIVIVIIGILAGVLIAVMDPTKQQNRAKDAVTKASISKLGFTINSYKSGEGNLPTGLVLSSGTGVDAVLINSTISTTCANNTDKLDCLVKVNGVALPQKCSSDLGAASVATTLTAVDAVECSFGIYSTGTNFTNGLFRITAAKYSDDKFYVFDSSEGLYDCSSVPAGTMADAVTATTCTLVNK